MVRGGPTLRAESTRAVPENVPQAVNPSASAPKQATVARR